ncbi:hypothetical protein KKH39_02885 [Patescibacteria group bacterium]|nr:hypothetical protein [Patescibacteria group bacterium]
MSIFVLSRGLKNKVNLYFGLLTFFNFLWALGLFLSRILVDDFTAQLLYRTAYFAAIWIAVFLFYFTLNFPYKIKDLNKYYRYFIWFFSILISILIYTKFHIISFERSANLANWFMNYYKPFYIIYSIFFFVLVLFAIYFLVDKLDKIEGFLKDKIKILLFTIIMGLIFGSYFNLILCYFQNWDYIWFGPIFTAFMNIYVFRLISLSKER